MKKLQNQVQATPRQQAQARYNSARVNLLLMIILTAVNIILSFLKVDYYLLFSATIPYLSVVFASVSGYTEFLVVAVCIAAIILIVYLLCWIFSKKQYGWMIAALVLFALDTVAMAGFFIFTGEFSGILDAIIHVVVLYYLIMGTVSGVKLSKLPEEIEEEELTPPAEDQE